MYAYVIHNVDEGCQPMVAEHVTLEAARRALRHELEECAAPDDEGVYEVFEMVRHRLQDGVDLDSILEDATRSLAIQDELEAEHPLRLFDETPSTAATFAYAAGRLLDVLFEAMGGGVHSFKIGQAWRGHWEVDVDAGGDRSARLFDEVEIRATGRGPTPRPRRQSSSRSLLAPRS